MTTHSICLRVVSTCAAAFFATSASADVRVGPTTVLGPFIGHHAPLHPDNAQARIEFYGTDLGWTYVHKGQVQFLFGDTWKSERGEPINKLHDDAFGAIDLGEWPDASRISAARIPAVKLATEGRSASLAALDAGALTSRRKNPRT